MRPRSVSQLAFGDLLGEALLSLTMRPGRAALTCLGTVAGIGSLVATLGLTNTAEAQVSGRFDALAATEVVVRDSGTSAGDTSAIPPDAEQMLSRVNGVRVAGYYWEVDLGGRTVVGRWGAPTEIGDDGLTVIAASPGAFDVIGPRVTAGRIFDDFHVADSLQVAVLGVSAAARLDVGALDAQPVIFMGDQPFTVIGTFDEVDRHPETLLSVVIPDSTARGLFRPAAPGEGLIVATAPGAAQQIAAEIPLALRPDAPDEVAVLAPPSPDQLRAQVSGDLTSLFLALAGVSVGISAFGIANTTLVAVLERINEIGLRRALGARSRHVAAQFLTESTALGTIGGAVGACIGVLVVVAVSLLRQWTTVLDPMVVLCAPLLGTVTGLVAGAYPAYKAASIEPVEALRA